MKKILVCMALLMCSVLSYANVDSNLVALDRSLSDLSIVLNIDNPKIYIDAWNAVINNDWKRVKYYLDLGISPNKIVGIMDNEPLIANVIAKEDLQAIKMVVESGADLNVKPDLYSEDQLLAQYMKHMNSWDDKKNAIVTYLIRNGADVNPQEGSLSLDIAQNKQFAELIELLYISGATTSVLQKVFFIPKEMSSFIAAAIVMNNREMLSYNLERLLKLSKEEIIKAVAEALVIPFKIKRTELVSAVILYLINHGKEDYVDLIKSKLGDLLYADKNFRVLVPTIEKEMRDFFAQVMLGQQLMTKQYADIIFGKVVPCTTPEDAEKMCQEGELGHWDTVKKMLECGADPNFISKKYRKILCSAALVNNATMIHLIISKGGVCDFDTLYCYVFGKGWEVWQIDSPERAVSIQVLLFLLRMLVVSEQEPDNLNVLFDSLARANCLLPYKACLMRFKKPDIHEPKLDNSVLDYYKTIQFYKKHAAFKVGQQDQGFADIYQYALCFNDKEMLVKFLKNHEEYIKKLSESKLVSILTQSLLWPIQLKMTDLVAESIKIIKPWIKPEILLMVKQRLIVEVTKEPWIQLVPEAAHEVEKLFA